MLNSMNLDFQPKHFWMLCYFSPRLLPCDGREVKCFSVLDWFCHSHFEFPFSLDTLFVNGVASCKGNSAFGSHHWIYCLYWLWFWPWKLLPWFKELTRFFQSELPPLSCRAFCHYLRLKCPKSIGSWPGLSARSLNCFLGIYFIICTIYHLVCGFHEKFHFNLTSSHQ